MEAPDELKDLLFNDDPDPIFSNSNSIAILCSCQRLDVEGVQGFGCFRGREHRSNPSYHFV
jgi:hypothetical protein